MYFVLGYLVDTEYEVSLESYYYTALICLFF